MIYKWVSPLCNSHHGKHNYNIQKAGQHRTSKENTSYYCHFTVSCLNPIWNSLTSNIQEHKRVLFKFIVAKLQF